MGPCCQCILILFGGDKEKWVWKLYVKFSLWEACYCIFCLKRTGGRVYLIFYCGGVVWQHQYNGTKVLVLQCTVLKCCREDDQASGNVFTGCVIQYYHSLVYFYLWFNLSLFSFSLFSYFFLVYLQSDLTLIYTMRTDRNVKSRPSIYDLIIVLMFLISIVYTFIFIWKVLVILYIYIKYQYINWKHL